MAGIGKRKRSKKERMKRKERKKGADEKVVFRVCAYVRLYMSGCRCGRKKRKGGDRGEKK